MFDQFPDGDGDYKAMLTTVIDVLLILALLVVIGGLMEGLN